MLSLVNLAFLVSFFVRLFPKMAINFWLISLADFGTVKTWTATVGTSTSSYGSSFCSTLKTLPGLPQLDG